MKELVTKKLYYSKYGHRVILFCRRSHYTGRSKKILSYPSEDTVLDFAQEYFGESKNYRSRCEWTYSGPNKTTGSNVTFYFNDPKFLETISNRFNNSVTLVERPLDQNHTDLLTKERVITRKTLFRGKYRYCIRTEARRTSGSWRNCMNHAKEMMEWHKKTFSHLKENQDYSIYQGWNTVNFFFANASDAMFMKLTWGDYIVSTDRIVLLNELAPISQSE